MLINLLFSGFLLISGPDHGPSPEMFDELKSAETTQEAGPVSQDILDAWLESGSAATDLLISRAMEAMSYGDVEHARELLDRAIAIQPDFAAAWHQRALLFLNDENYPEALRDMNEVLRLEPRHFAAWAGLGMVLEGLGSIAEARAAYEKALDIYPLFPMAQNGLNRLQERTEGRPV